MLFLCYSIFIMKMIIIGNMISFVAACFTISSSYAKTNYQTYIQQSIQCFLLAIASIFFHSYSGLATLLLCSIRNYIVAIDKFNKTLCILFLISLGLIGILVNNLGVVGLIPVFATLIYTIGSLILNDEILVKLHVILNLFLWAVYDFFILDIMSICVDTFSIIVAFVAIYQIYKQRKTLD